MLLSQNFSFSRCNINTVKQSRITEESFRCKTLNLSIFSNCSQISPFVCHTIYVFSSNLFNTGIFSFEHKICIFLEFIFIYSFVFFALIFKYFKFSKSSLFDSFVELFLDFLVNLIHILF